MDANVHVCCSTPEQIPRGMSSVSLQKQDSDASSSIRGESFICFVTIHKELLNEGKDQL